MPVRVWREVIVPLLGRVSAVLVGISTPVDSFNFFSKLIKMTHPKTGKPLFLTAIIELSCDRCKAKDRAHMCRHKMKFLPPWKSRKNQDVTDMLLRDQATTIARESMGVVIDEGAFLFLVICPFPLQKVAQNLQKGCALDLWVLSWRVLLFPRVRAVLLVLGSR